MSGIKRRIAVDTEDLPHAIHVTAANISDKAGTFEMMSLRASSLSTVINVLCDGGYTGRPFAGCVKATIGADIEIMKRSDRHTFKALPGCRIVERSFGYLIKAADFGKTANAGSIRPVRWWFLPLSLYCLKDFEQALRNCTVSRRVWADGRIFFSARQDIARIPEIFQGFLAQGILTAKMYIEVC